MALTDLIEADLLATLDGTGDPQAVLARYAGSKGPFYAALARATAQAAERFTGIRDRWVTTRAQLQVSENALADAEVRAQRVERRVRAAEKQLTRATATLARQHALLDQAQALRDGGFDEASLTALTRVLAQVDGTTPAEAVAQFLQAATDFGGLTTFARRAHDAEARAEQAEAAARRRAQQAQLRHAAVDRAEWFVRQGITTPTLRAWQAIGQSLGLSPETLAAGVGSSLQQFGTLVAACQAKMQERDALTREIRQRRAALAELTAERETITAALQAVAQHGSQAVADARTHAVAAVAAMRNDTLATLRETVTQYAALKTEAASLEPVVRFARTLMDPADPAWQTVSPEQWSGLLRQFKRYLTSREDSPGPVPEQVSKQLQDRLRYPTLSGQPRLTELVEWLIAGLYGPIPDTSSLPDSASRYLPDGRG